MVTSLQVFVGRIAMIGFAAALVGEIQTGGKGPLGQLALPIQTPVNPDVAGMSETLHPIKSSGGGVGVDETWKTCRQCFNEGESC